MGLPDLGAYEYGSSGGATPTPIPTTPPGHKTGDVNNDGKVNIVDIGILIDNYAQQVEPGSEMDLDNNGIINIIDIGIIIDHYEL